MYSLSLHLILFFPLPLFIESEIYETIHSNFLRCSSISEEKKSGRKSFLLEYLRSNFETEVLQATSAYKRREFWCETHTSLGLLIKRIISLTCKKIIVRDSDWTYRFLIAFVFVFFIFTCEKHRPLL